MKQQKLIFLLALLATATTADLAIAQPITEKASLSATFWRDICAGQRAEISRRDQNTLCLTYLSSFQDATDEYSEAGFKLFCPPDTISLETRRTIFLAYINEFAETADFLPVGRALLQALMHAYPCKNKE